MAVDRELSNTSNTNNLLENPMVLQAGGVPIPLCPGDNSVVLTDKHVEEQFPASSAKTFSNNEHERFVAYRHTPVPPGLIPGDVLGGKPLADFATLELEFGMHWYGVVNRYITKSDHVDSSSDLSMSVVSKQSRRNTFSAFLSNAKNKVKKNEQHTEAILGPGMFKLKNYQGNEMYALHYNLGPPVASHMEPLIHKILVLFVHKDAKSNVDGKTDHGAKEILHNYVEDAMRWETKNTNKEEIQIFHHDVRAGRWRLVSSKRGRPLDSVFLPSALKAKVVDDMKRFLSQRAVRWYHKHGVPYKRSYMFYGPPGSGKTSFIQALAHRFERNLCFLNPSSPEFTDDSLVIAIQSCPVNSIIVLEDIDALFSKNRDSKCQAMSVTFSGLLNALDGMANPDGQLFALTTNHIDRLDSALIRHGRVDLRVEFSTATDEQLKDIFSSFLDDMNHDDENDSPSAEKSDDSKQTQEVQKEGSDDSDDWPMAEFTPLTEDEQKQASKDWVKAWRKQFPLGVPMATVQSLCISEMGSSPKRLIEAIKELKQYEQLHDSENSSSFYM